MTALVWFNLNDEDGNIDVSMSSSDGDVYSSGTVVVEPGQDYEGVSYLDMFVAGSGTIDFSGKKPVISPLEEDE